MQFLLHPTQLDENIWGKKRALFFSVITNYDSSLRLHVLIFNIFEALGFSGVILLVLLWLRLKLVILFVIENIMSLNYSGFQRSLKSSLVEADFPSSSLIMFPVPRTALQLCAVAALASGLTLSSLAPHTLLPPLPLGALAPALLASTLNLTLMQSERPLAVLRHPYSASSASGLQSTAIAFHLLSFRLQVSPPLLPPRAFTPSLSSTAVAGMLQLQLMWLGEPCEGRYNA